LPATAHAMRIDIHFYIAEHQLLAGERRTNSAKHRAHASDQFARAEGLGHIIVSAGLKSPNAVAFLAPRGQHDDWHLRRRAPPPKAPADLDPRDPLDHPVEDHQVRSSLLC